MELRWSSLTFNDFARDIIDGKPYSFARYGDGEWGWIVETKVRNRDGHQTFKQASAELRLALQSLPRYRVGNMRALEHWETRDVEHQKRWGRPMDWIQVHGLADLEWHNNLVWVDEQVRAAAAGERFPLLDVLSHQRLVIVGPPYLAELNAGVLPMARFISVRRPDCWLDIDRAEAEILQDWQETHERERTVYGLSCSLVANLLVHRLYDIMGQDSWLIDFGSIWEPYVGRVIRHYQIEWQERGQWPPKV